MEISAKELKKLNIQEEGVWYTCSYFLGMIPGTIWLGYRDKSSIRLRDRILCVLKYRV